MFQTLSQKWNFVFALVGASIILFPILLVGAGYTKRSRQLRGLGWLVWVCLIVTAAAAWSFPPHRVIPGDEEKLKPTGDAIVAALAAYHKRNGHYPDKLEAAFGSVPAANEYGPWRYDCIDNGEHYTLTAGSIDIHGFELIYDDASGVWVVVH